MRGKDFWTLLKRTFAEWSDDRVSTLAAAFAYYAVFSTGPLLLIAVAVLGFLFGQQAAHGQLHQQIANIVGPAGSGMVEQLISGAGRFGSGVVATIIGGCLLIYSSTYLFMVLQDSLNLIWDVQPRPDNSWWVTIRQRGLSFVMVVFVALLLLGSVVASTVVGAIVGQPADNSPGAQAMVTQSATPGAQTTMVTRGPQGATPQAAAAGGAEQAGAPWWYRALNVGLSLILFTAAFTVIFKYLPDVNIKWRDVFLGAVISAVLLTLGKWGLGVYFAHSSTASVYGAAGSLVLLMIFIYYSSQIVFLCAEFTQVWARRHGDSIEPSKHAEPIGNKQPVSGTAPPPKRKPHLTARPLSRRAPETPQNAPLRPEDGRAAPEPRPTGRG